MIITTKAQLEISSDVLTVHGNLKDQDATLINIIQLTNNIFKFYNNIVLSGDYINPAYKSELSWVSERVDELMLALFGQPLVIEDAINNLKSVLDDANSMLDILHSRTCLNNKERNYLSEYSSLNNFEKKFSSLGRSSYIIFVQNIKLAFYDHFLSIKTEQLERLFQIRSILSDVTLRHHPEVVTPIDKCNYLIFKVLLRLSRDENKYPYLYNNKDTLIDINAIRNEIEIFKPFLEITEAHYSDQSFQGNRWINPDIIKKGQIVNKKLNKNANLTHEEFHTLIKFLKDVNHSWKDIIKVKESFFSINSFNKLTEDFDSTAFDIDKNYIYNNLISSAVEDKEDITNIKSTLDDIIQLQKDTEIKNYFPFFKVAAYYKTLIETMFSDLADTGYENLNKIEVWIQDYKHVINQCYQTFRWCKDRNYTAFQLPFNECVREVDIKGSKQNIFLASSFVLPLNYTEIETELGKLDRDYNRIKTQVALYRTVKKERLEIEKIRNILNNEVIERDRKQIEILGIFAAIVLFSVSEVQLFTKVTSIPEAILFSLAFAYSLSTFVILIWIITRNYKIKVTALHWILATVFILTTAVLYATLIGWELMKGLTFKW